MLNLPGHHSTAAIVAEITDTGSGRRPGNGYPGIVLQISDCARAVSIDLNIHGETPFENSLYKVDTMIEHLRALRRGMVIERKRYISRRGTEYNDE